MPLLAALLLLVLALGGAGYVRAYGLRLPTRLVGGTGTPRSAARPDVAGTPVPAAQPYEPPVPDTPEPTPVPTPDPGAAALAAVEGHWEAIREHQFDQAYAFLGPHLATGQAAWVASHQRDGISDVVYQFAVGSVGPDTATVDIVQLQTYAQSAQTPGNPSGCLAWTGTYGLVQINGAWLVDQANLRSSPC